MSFETLMADRAAAGAAYAAAVVELEICYKNLAALDNVLRGNTRFAGRGFDVTAPYGFHPNPLHALPESLVHTEFQPRTVGWDDAIRAMAAQLEKAY